MPPSIPRLPDIRKLLEGYAPGSMPATDEWEAAAVALVLREAERDLELLFIRRAQFEGDPWSGHMAFPGGRVDPGDAHPRAAALRETREELALDLNATGEYLGRLSDLNAYGRGKRLNLFVRPFVYALTRESVIDTNHEVEEALWIPMSFLANRDLREDFTYLSPVEGVKYTMPCYTWEERRIWGLTFWMLDEFLELVVPSGAGTAGDPRRAIRRARDPRKG